MSIKSWMRSFFFLGLPPCKRDDTQHRRAVCTWQRLAEEINYLASFTNIWGLQKKDNTHIFLLKLLCQSSGLLVRPLVLVVKSAQRDFIFPVVDLNKQNKKVSYQTFYTKIKAVVCPAVVFLAQVLQDLCEFHPSFITHWSIPACSGCSTSKHDPDSLWFGYF